MSTETRSTLPCPSCGTLNRVDLSRAADGPKCGRCAKAIPLDRPLPLSDAAFERVVADAGVPVLVDFYADWCGPCKMMAPVLDDLARQRAGRLLVAKVDTDRNPMAAQRHGITSLPTLVVLSGGREVGRELGAIPRPRLDALVDRAFVNR